MRFRLLMELEYGFISYLLLHQRSFPDADDIALIAPPSPRLRIPDQPGQ